MEHDTVPPDLAAALARAGYRIGGPAGVGSHGPAWTAVGREDGPAAGMRVVVTVLAVPAGPPGEALGARLDALRAVRHEHLAEIVDVVPLGGLPLTDDGARSAPLVAGRWAVLLAEVPGVNLAALLAARAPLADGEAVTLAVPLAEALAALHDAGLAHGDVSPANVVVGLDGRPVLVDLLGAVTGDAGTGPGGGTPGFASPEVERGAGPGPAADVHALARVVLAALAVGGAPGLRAVLADACSADAAARPAAAELAVRCYAAAPPQPLAVPDAAVLARTTLARLAIASSPRSVLTVRPSGSRHRSGRGRLRTAVRILVAVGAVAGCAALVAGVVAGGIAWGPVDGDGSGGATRSAAGADGAGAADPSPARSTDPLTSAVALTERRLVVLAGGDPDDLAEIDLVGSGAHTADLEVLARLRAAGQRIDGLAAVVVSARLVEPAAVEPAAVEPDLVRPVRVEITSELTAHRRVTAAGVAAAEIPAQPPRTVVLTLAWTTDGWRVAEVAGAPLSGSGG